MNKKTLTILGIVLLVVIAGSFWYVKNQEKTIKPIDVIKEAQKENDEKKENEVALESDKEIEELDFDEVDTSDWKTYRNEEYGFEFKYPGVNWSLEDEHLNGGNSVILRNEKAIKNHKLDSIWISDYNTVSDYFYESSDGLDSNTTNLIDLLKKHPLIKNVEPIKFQYYSGLSTSKNGYGTYFTIFTENEKHFYSISLDAVSEKNKLSDVHKTILQSFKFIK